MVWAGADPASAPCCCSPWLELAAGALVAQSEPQSDPVVWMKPLSVWVKSLSVTTPGSQRGRRGILSSHGPAAAEIWCPREPMSQAELLMQERGLLRGGP